MKVQAPFGFVTGCHTGDRFMVQATLASMRHFCPQIPICLVVDGSFDVSDLESEYGLIVLRISELPSKEMRNLMSGNGRAKLAAMWQGPFEFYVWLEAELWGRETPGLFGDFYEQPLLNYFVHSMTQRGEIRSTMSDLQHVWVHHGKEELMKDCNGAGWHFPTEIGRPRVAHFCGRKPFLSHPKAYSRPFTVARLEHHRRRHSRLGAWQAIMNEEAP